MSNDNNSSGSQLNPRTNPYSKENNPASIAEAFARVPQLDPAIGGQCPGGEFAPRYLPPVRVGDVTIIRGWCKPNPGLLAIDWPLDHVPELYWKSPFPYIWQCECGVRNNPMLEECKEESCSEPMKLDSMVYNMLGNHLGTWESHSIEGAEPLSLDDWKRRHVVEWVQGSHSEDETAKWWARNASVLRPPRTGEP